MPNCEGWPSLSYLGIGLKDGLEWIIIGDEKASEGFGEYSQGKTVSA
jgi:hypothetical protein